MPPPRAHDHIPVIELDSAPLRPIITPMPTVFTLTRDALQAGRLGTPRVWRQAALSHFRARDAEAFAPLSDPETMGWPSLLDEVGNQHESVDEALERVAAIPGDALANALEKDRDVTATKAWDPLRSDPDRWLRAYVDALDRGWRGLEPLWQRSMPLLEREAERIDAIVDRGVSHAQVLSEFSPRAAIHADDWQTPAQPEPRRLRVSPEGIRVVPMLAAEACFLSTPDDTIVRLFYPLSEAWRAFDDNGPPPASLEALLGPQRSALLRRLDQALTPSYLAGVLFLAPSAVTFHLRALEAAGLVYRERRGRNVLVHRTGRGTALLALYELR